MVGSARGSMPGGQARASALLLHRSYRVLYRVPPEAGDNRYAPGRVEWLAGGDGASSSSVSPVALRGLSPVDRARLAALLAQPH
jgi:hypothetical protein